MPRSASHYAPITRRDLTARQQQVLALIADGKTNPEIAGILGISLDGAKWHVSEILTKLGVESREQAAEWWVQEGRLLTRVRRLATGLAGSGAVRWLAAATATGIAAGVVLVLYTASQSGGNEPSAPDSPGNETATATATSTATTAAAPTGTSTIPGANPSTTPSTTRAVTNDPDRLANGRLVVYMDELASAGDKEVVTYDLDNRRIIGAFQVASGPYVAVDPNRRKVFFEDDGQIFESNLDGSDRRSMFTLPGGSTLIGVVPSADGEHLAIGFVRNDIRDVDTGLVILETRSGDVTLEMPVEQLRPLGFMGAPAPTAWKGDAVRVFGYAGKDGTVWPTARISLDGSITIVPPGDPSNYESPGGSLALTTEDELVYACFGGGYIFPATGIIDLATGEELVDLDDEEHYVTLAAWSDDGQSALLEVYRLSWRDGRPCVSLDEMPEYWAWEAGSLEVVSDLQALLRRWDGDRFIEIECDGVILDPGYPISTNYLTCSPMADTPPATIYVGGERIDSVREGSILAFIE